MRDRRDVRHRIQPCNRAADRVDDVDLDDLNAEPPRTVGRAHDASLAHPPRRPTWIGTSRMAIADLSLPDDFVAGVDERP